MPAAKKKSPSREPWMGKAAPQLGAPTGKIHLKKLVVHPFEPRANQQEAVETLAENDMTFLVGPAGTGKTFLAARQAVADLKSGKATKLVLTRAAVEAGESIGFLPGDVRAKMELYCQPMLDALALFLGKGVVTLMLDQGFIELIPLTYLRGKSVPDAVIIIDEFQNATPHQGKLCLTRAGENTRVIVTCDPEQIDLEDHIPSAIEDLYIFQNYTGIGYVTFTAVDVVRSRLCRTVLAAYENARPPRTA